MEKYSNYLEFYEEKIGGGFENGDPCCYKIEGNSFEAVANISDVLWQAVEVEGFDNRKVLAKMRIEKNGNTIRKEKFYIEADVARSNEPSKFIVWNGKKPHIFAIDRSRSHIKVTVELPFKPTEIEVTICTE